MPKEPPLPLMKELGEQSNCDYLFFTLFQAFNNEHQDCRWEIL